MFFITQAAVFLIWDILGLPSLNPFYNLVDTVFPLTLFGFIFGVGLTEELGKALPLFIINRRTNVPLIPQTLVFYGLMSGIAFGVFEGVKLGTVICALFNGFLIGLFSKWLENHFDFRNKFKTEKYFQ